MPGWYVFAVESNSPRPLTPTEEAVVKDFRFGFKLIGQKRKPDCGTQPGFDF
jgi:hypothetical protein